MWYYFEILHLLTNQISIYTFLTLKYQKKCSTNLIGQCEVPLTWLLQERCRDAAVHFQSWVEQTTELSFSDCDTKSCMLKQHFTVSRTVELSSEGVSKLVLTLDSIGGRENSPDEHVCETTPGSLERIGMHCYCVWLLLACLASYSGFLP